MQEWTRSGMSVPAIGEAHVLLGTLIIGWGPLLGTPQAPPENHEMPTAAVEGEAAEQPLENGNPEDTSCLFPWKHAPSQKKARPTGSMPRSHPRTSPPSPLA